MKSVSTNIHSTCGGFRHAVHSFIAIASSIVLLLTSVSCAASSNQPRLPRDSFVYVQGDASTIALVVCSVADEQDCKISLDKNGMHIIASGIVVADSRTHKDRQYVMTSAHVCMAAESYRDEIRSLFERNEHVKLIDVNYDFYLTGFGNDGRQHRLKVVGLDIQHDICIAATEDRHTSRPARLARSMPHSGARVYNLAAPLGIWQPGSTLTFAGFYAGAYTCVEDERDSFEIRCTVGEKTWSIFTIDATGGSSGSAVFNSRGEVIGIVSMVPTSFKSVVYTSRLEHMRALLTRVLDHEMTVYGSDAGIDFDAPGIETDDIVLMDVDDETSTSD